MAVNKLQGSESSARERVSIWAFITRPHDAIKDTETRARSQLLAAMTLIASLTGVVLLGVVLLVRPSILTYLNVQAAMAGLALFPVSYIINRTGRYQMAAHAFIITALATTVILGYSPLSAAETAPLVILPLLLAAFYFSPRSVLAYTALQLITVGALYAIGNDLEQPDYLYGTIVLVFLDVIVVTFVFYQIGAEDRRRKELEDRNRKLRESEVNLELRVVERTAEVQAAYEEVQALYKVKDDFVANVSHELRTPITNMKLHQMLLEKTAHEGQQDTLETLKRETLRLQALIESLLLLSRLDQNRIEFKWETVDLHRLVTEYVEDRALLASERGLTMQCETCPEPAQARADSNMLGQVLSILMTNALNYTPSGGQINVTTDTRRDDQGRWVGFTVRDNGPGISDEDRVHLFSRFFRGRAAHETNVSGTGLGLAIAREIVNRHEGQIEIASSGEGQGSAFSIWLPEAK